MFNEINKYLWEIPKNFRPDMKVPARIYASKKILEETEERAIEQTINMTTLPGIFRYSLAMPDIHTGFGPPIGGIAATEFPKGIISPGAIGFDENCGCRVLLSDCMESEIKNYLEKLAIEIQKEVPSGLGRGRDLKLSAEEINKILKKGIPYLVEKGFGRKEDIDNCEEEGLMKSADAESVSQRAKERGRDQVGTLGSGNHFIEIQKVEEIFNKETADVFGLFKDQIVVMIHTGSRGLGHQNCTDYLKVAEQSMKKYNINLPDRELACMPFDSPEGQRFFKAMSAASNYAWANRHMITCYTRKAWKKVLGKSSELKLLYDVAHNIAKIEEHEIEGIKKKLIVHRKGATRSFPPGSNEIPEKYRSVGQPSLIPGTMGTASYILSGTEESKESWHSICHGAGRKMSRKEAVRKTKGRGIVKEMRERKVIVKCHSRKGISEEYPEAYKDINEVIDVIHGARLAKKVAKLIPLVVIKGE